MKCLWVVLIDVFLVVTGVAVDRCEHGDEGACQAMQARSMLQVARNTPHVASTMSHPACGTGRVTQKHDPNSAVDGVPPVNGCGPEWLEKKANDIIPSFVGINAADIVAKAVGEASTKCCEIHDIEYNTCSMNQLDADNNALECWRKAFDNDLFASSFYVAVLTMGLEAKQAAVDKYCECKYDGVAPYVIPIPTLPPAPPPFQPVPVPAPLPPLPTPEACLTSAAMMLTANGKTPIATLKATSPVNVFELANIGEDGRVQPDDLLGVAEGQVAGWAVFDPEKTRGILELTYESSDDTLQVTPGHYLMVKDVDNGVVLKQAQRVDVGDHLAATPADGQAGVSWRRVLSLQNRTATGFYMPLITSDAGPGDVLVMADGILVPIYSEYGGMTPSQAHQVFAVWDKKWQELLHQHPCLSQVPRHHHASIAVEMVRDFSMRHPARLLKEELNPSLMICYYSKLERFQEYCPELAYMDCD